jgi:hypothetical protein
MRYRPAVQIILCAYLVFLGGRLNASADECDQTANLRIYSNASFIEEAGDVVGYEMATQWPDGTSISALLYVYEGVPTKEGIFISGRISGKRVTMKGDWVEHLIEEPSKKEVVATHHISVSGMLDSTSFRGSIKIEGVATLSNVRLKRTSHVWMCRNSAKSRLIR